MKKPDPIPARLAALWGELLRIEPATISRSARFFDLGGNSLQLMQLQNMARTRLGVALSMREAYACPTLGDLAAHVDTLTAGPEALGPILEGAGPMSHAPASFPQTRLWLLDQIEGSNAQYNLPAALKVSIPFDADRAEAILQRLVDRHEPLRTRFDVSGASPAFRAVLNWFDQSICEGTEDVASN